MEKQKVPTMQKRRSKGEGSPTSPCRTKTPHDVDHISPDAQIYQTVGLDPPVFDVP